jgi:outer membrane protein
MHLTTTKFHSNNFLQTGLCVLVFLCCGVVQAQEIKVLSLKEALERARHNNRNILKSEIEMELSHENVKESKEERLPEIEIEGMYSRITNLTQFKKSGFRDREMTRTIPEIYEAVTKFSVPVYEGNKINNNIKIASSQYEISKIKKEKTESNIELDVIETYLQIYKMMELQKIIEENIKEEEERLKEVKSLHKHGTVTKNEVIRAELQLADRELNRLTNSKNILIALHDLQTLVQIPEDQKIAIETVDVLPEQIPMESYDFFLTQAFQNEEMRVASQEIGIRKLEKKNAIANYFPKIHFFGNYSFKYPNYMFFPPEPYLYTLGQVGIAASYDISGLYKNKTKIKIADAKMEWQKMQSGIVKDKVSDELYKNYTQYHEITEKFKVVDKACQLADENYRIVKLKYLNQLVLITEMVDADNALLQAKYNKISTRIDAVMKHYELLHTAGILTNKFN